MTQRTTTRRGVSLIEVLVAITIGSVVMAAVATGTATLLRVNQRVQSRANAGPQVEQLARRLRADLRDADQATWDADSGRIELTLADGAAISYTNDGDRCLREQDGRVEPYRLPAAAELHCDVDSAAAPDYFEVTVQIDPARGLPVGACLGGAHRLLLEGGSP